jgi:hypothetical protein
MLYQALCSIAHKLYDTASRNVIKRAVTMIDSFDQKASGWYIEQVVKDEQVDDQLTRNANKQ